MLVNVVPQNDLIQVATTGRITQASLDPDNDPLASQQPDIYSQRVLFDLSGSDYMDSSGVSWLLGCHKRFREAGGTMIIHSVNPLVAQVLKVLKLDQVLHLADTAIEARRQLDEVKAP